MPTTAIAAAPADAATPAGERVDPQALATLAAEVAHRQAASNTRRAYAAAYRQLAALLALELGRSPRREDLTAEAVRRYRDHLEQAGRDPATIAKVARSAGIGHVTPHQLRHKWCIGGTERSDLRSASSDLRGGGVVSLGPVTSGHRQER